MKVIVYEPSYDPKHQEVLRALAKGIPGARVKSINDYEPCDVAVIFGLVKRAYRPTWTKQTVLDNHKGRSLIVVESAFVRRGQYWAVGFGGQHNNADFNDSEVGLERWFKLDIELIPWQNRPGAPVVVCGQLQRDTNVQNTNHYAWCQSVVDQLKEKGFTVKFRPHPREKFPSVYGIDPALWDRQPISWTLNEAQAVVIWNSTSGVEAAIAGVPVIACNQGAMSWPVSNHGLLPLLNSKLEKPSRERWLARLGYSQWTLEEMSSGQTWEHLMS